MKKILCGLLAALCLTSCQANAAKVKVAEPVQISIDQSDFVRASADFAVELLQKSVEGGRNEMISPVSAMLALGMTGTGADKETKTAFETLLGDGMSIEDLNKEYQKLQTTAEGVKNGKVHIANSIFYNAVTSDCYLLEDYKKTVQEVYRTELFCKPYDEKTLDEINGWVSQKTEKKIPVILEKLPGNTLCVLLNAIYFQMDWARGFREPGESGVFTRDSGEEVAAMYLRETEALAVFRDEDATGFFKDYEDSPYSFFAILPEHQTAEQYLGSLTGEGLLTLLNSAKMERIHISLPEFQFSQKYQWSEALKEMGLEIAFEPAANFSHMANESLQIEGVYHRTAIEVNQNGTVAAAATAVTMTGSGSTMPEPILLDRSFLFGILDRENSNLLFLGILQDPEVKGMCLN